jgi:hypothetical protein
LAVSGGDGGGGKTELLAAVETPAMTVFTGSSPVFPISLCFLFFFSFCSSSFSLFFSFLFPLSVLSSLSLFCFSLLSLYFSSLFFSLFLFSVPIFALSSPVQEKQGRER